MTAKHRSVERGDEVAAFRALLNDHRRLITFRGPPGVGKTALARACATDLGAEGVRVAFVSLQPTARRLAILSTFARTLGVSSRTSNEEVLVERIVRELEDQPTVLFLDDVDLVREELRSLLRVLVAETTAATFVACGRAALGLSEESIVVVSPLKASIATSLLRARAQQLAPERSLPSDIAERLSACAGGLPLAIEIVAGWVAAIGATETLAALREGGLALDALDQALDASWALLDEDVRGTFASLGVFTATFDLEAARAVAGTPHVATHLAALASASLLEVNETNDGVRYAMLEGVRRYALRQATRAGVADAARERLSMHLAHTVRPRADLPASWARLARERDDILFAWKSAIGTDAARALRLAVVVEPSLAAHGPPALHRMVIEQSIAAGDQAQLPLRAGERAQPAIDLLYSLGRLEAFRSQYAASVAPFERGIAMATSIGDFVRAAWLSALLAESFRVLGDLDRADACITEARRIADREADERLRSTAYRAYAGWQEAKGELPAAEESFRRAIAAARAANAVRLEGIALLGCAMLQRKRGRIEEARAYITDADTCFKTVSDAVYGARASAERGHLHLATGAVPHALAAFQRAFDDAEIHDDVEGQLEAQAGLIRVAHAERNPLLAARRIDVAEALRRRSDAPVWSARIAELRAEIEGRTSSETIPFDLSRDGRTFELLGKAVDFGRRGPLRRILVTLAQNHEVRPPRALTVAELLAAGWPDEKMAHDSGTARVYMAVRRLRGLGLEAILRTSDEGYSLDERVRIAWR